MYVQLNCGLLIRVCQNMRRKNINPLNIYGKHLHSRKTDHYIYEILVEELGDQFQSFHHQHPEVYAVDYHPNVKQVLMKKHT